MNFIYGFIPNYGIAIIILTIVTKLILWPLGSKSYKSMNEMKKIQPLMAELREKYSNDKKKMNEELMKLYRVYKINPMGGCPSHGRADSGFHRTLPNALRGHRASACAIHVVDQ